MLDLLKWRAHPERINDSLSKLKEIDGSEIVKVQWESLWDLFFFITFFFLLLFGHPTGFANGSWQHFHFIFPCVPSFCRTPWTLCSASWTRVHRDMASKCLTPWWVALFFLKVFRVGGQLDSNPATGTRPGTFHSIPKNVFINSTLRKLTFAENDWFLQGFKQKHIFVLFFCAATALFPNSGSMKYVYSILSALPS